ncbi:hypothetical protein K32_01570 [Kaistia sp. 32K]|uniref:hypothetical protein n=1 Tax=Kaistia sp. 32K TaxID=2795690 RepID=UPI0019151FC7|nr:hypothetical protein [Kaistia sp. 32K]BCP51540.1 hypothetical protein K32_01570 [Kaistia sp. 32K]
MRTFLRIILLIPLGLMAAIASAVVVYLAAFGFTANDIWDGPNGEIPVILAPAFVLLVEISRYALLPFVAGIVVAEIFALRSAIQWTLFGGAIGLGMHLAANSTEFAALPPVAAGLVAGFAYWVFAGHGSGTVVRPAPERAVSVPPAPPTSPAPE